MKGMDPRASLLILLYMRDNFIISWLFFFEKVCPIQFHDIMNLVKRKLVNPLQFRLRSTEHVFISLR